MNDLKYIQLLCGLERMYGQIMKRHTEVELKKMEVEEIKSRALDRAVNKIESKMIYK